MKEIEDDTNRWKDIWCFWIRRINIVKMTILLPKAIYRFSAIPIKLPMAFFTKVEQKIFSFVWKHKRLQIAKEILRKKNSWRNKAPWRQDYTKKTTVIKIVWHWDRTRNTDQQNRTESPDINPCAYDHLWQSKQEHTMEKRLFLQ